METILLRCSLETSSIFSTSISDVGDGPSTLYLLNGGIYPPHPGVGHFLYDFSARTIWVYGLPGWIQVTISQMCSGFKHPKGSNSVMSFTGKALPYWMPSDQDPSGNLCPFTSVDSLLDQFVGVFDSNKIAIETPQDRSKRKSSQGSVELVENGLRNTKRVRRVTDSSPTYERMKLQEPLRFVHSSVGFPPGSEKIRWDAGFETYEPFAGMRSKKDLEKALVTALARCRSSERSGSEACNSDPESVMVRDLIVELELHPVLRNPHEYDEESLDQAWTDLVDQVNAFMRKSTSVVIRGWTPDLTLKLSSPLIAKQFGDLGQNCQWVDGVLYALPAGYKGKKAAHHRHTTLGRFVELISDPTVCGNFLDGKDVKPRVPFWIDPLLDSTTAWNQTMGQKVIQNGKGKLTSYPIGPALLDSAIWNSQGWRLLTHPGFITYPHHDCCGMCTYIIGNTGAKIWGVIRPKRRNHTTSLTDLPKVLEQALDLSPEGTFPQADVATVCLEEGDVMFQPPGVLHSVYTPVPSAFTGGYFFSYATMPQTRAVLSLLSVHKPGSLTNDERPGFKRTLSRMLISLRYRLKPRRISKKSLLSLILMVIDWDHAGKRTRGKRDPSSPEEDGEIAFAAQCARSLLIWMKTNVEQAEKFVDNDGPYYSGGEEVVEIPALAEGAEDRIFPTL